MQKSLKFFNKDKGKNDFQNSPLCANFYGKTLTKELFKDYKSFVKIVEKFKEFYGLSEYNSREIDHFLWLFGKEILDKNVQNITEKEKLLHL